jgi:hypothetical protein
LFDVEGEEDEGLFAPFYGTEQGAASSSAAKTPPLDARDADAYDEYLNDPERRREMLYWEYWVPGMVKEPGLEPDVIGLGGGAAGAAKSLIKNPGSKLKEAYRAGAAKEAKYLMEMYDNARLAGFYSAVNKAKRLDKLLNDKQYLAVKKKKLRGEELTDDEVRYMRALESDHALDKYMTKEQKEYYDKLNEFRKFYQKAD